ncbi:MAG: hypothetical protein ABJA76_15320 [Mucilaginibacter sp.]
MYKNLFIAILLILPFLTNAQSAPVFVKHIEKATWGISGTCKFDEHLNILQFDTGTNEFGLIAVNNKAEIVWRSTFNRAYMGFGKFKDNVLIITSPHNGFGGYQMPITGHIIDVKTGKILLEKSLFNIQTSNKIIVKPFFSESGSFFKLSVREAQSKKGFNPFSSASKYGKTKNLTIIDFNEKLEPVNQFNPKIDENAFISLATNNDGDLFIAAATNGYSVSFVKYIKGKQEPSLPINVEFDIRDKKDSDEPEKIIDNLKLAASGNSLYSCLIEKNEAKEYQLTVNKIDFEKMSKLQTTEVFTKERLAEIIKASPGVTDKYDVWVGKPKLLTVDYLQAFENNVIIVYSDRESVTTYDGHRNSYYVNAGSLVINCYDPYLKPKFLNIMPINYSAGGWFTPSYYYHSNTLSIVATNRAHTGGKFSGLIPMYGNLDLSDGKWKRLEYFDKSDLPSGSFNDHAMWYGDGFISLITDYNTFGKTNISFYKSAY